DFDPGAGVHILSTSTDYDAFILKLDSSGNYEWAYRFGSSTQPDYAYSLTVDPFGDVLLTGMNLGNCDMDPGPGTQMITPCAFVLKLDGNGQFQWVRQLGAFGDA